LPTWLLCPPKTHVATVAKFTFEKGTMKIVHKAYGRTSRLNQIQRSHLVMFLSIQWSIEGSNTVEKLKRFE
jgi:hypothetical protein